jgi:membrane AbrB-like protein
MAIRNLDPRPYLKTSMALLIGAAGGWIFLKIGMPLPWLLGALVFNTLAVMLHIPVLPPAHARPFVMVVIGVMLGSGFSPTLVDHIAGWGLSLGFLSLYLLISGIIVVPYYRYVAKFDLVTAFFAGMPGGLTEMVMIGRSMGGDDRRIVLAHSSRILVTVSLLALWFRFVAGVQLGNRSQLGTPFSAIPMIELGLLTLCGVLGYFVGRGLRLPAPMLLGPMLLSAVAHISGFASSPPPREVIIAAQIILGTMLGCRFSGSSPKSIVHALILSLGATTLMIGVTFAFALGLHEFFGQTTEQVLLAYAPGGLAEMSLVALAMHADVAYVASHHIMRITFVILVAPPLFRWLLRTKPGE